MDERKWVLTWGQAQAGLSYFSYPSEPKTYSIILNTAITGEAVRVTLSNTHGKEDVLIGAVTVCTCTEKGEATGEILPLTYGKKSSFTLRKGERIVSEEAPLELTVGAFYRVSIFVKKGKLLSGNLLDSATLLYQTGNQTGAVYAPDELRRRDDLRHKAEKSLGMYFPRPIPLLDAVEVRNADGAEAIVVYGDSLSQQGFWTNPFEKKLRAAYPGRYSFINKAVMGNRLLYDYNKWFPAGDLYGTRALTRISDDVYPYENVRYMILALGVNDCFEFKSINSPGAGEKPDPKDVCNALLTIAKNMQARGTKVVALNIIPFGANRDASHEKDDVRREVNRLLDENKASFDVFVDIATPFSDPHDDYYAEPSYVGPDKLHPNAKGGAVIADQIDLSIFK